MEDTPTRVGAAHGRGDHLRRVRGEGLEPRGVAAGYVGSGAEAVDIGGLDYIVPAHKGGGDERVGENVRVVQYVLASSDGAYRGHSRAEEGAPVVVVVGIPREFPVAGEPGRAARRHPRSALTGLNKRCVASARQIHWYNSSPWTGSGSACLQILCVV
jgi:hypothetical protein